MNQPTADVRAILRALLALTTQVKRIADHTAQGSFALAPPVVVSPDDAPTTGDDGRSRASRFLDAVTHSGPGYDYPAPAADDADATCHRMESRTCPQSFNGPCGERPCARFESDDPGPWLDPATVRVTHWNPLSKQLAEEKQELAGMVGAFVDAQVQHARAADEDALRTARRDSLLVLLSRAYRGTLIPEESELLRHHVEAEIHESNTARGVAANNVRHVQQLVPEIEAQHAIIERARGMLRHLKDQGATGKTYYVALTSALNGGMQPLCHSSDPTTLRECALRIGHGADHEDGDLSWPATPDSTEIDRLTEEREQQRTRAAQAEDLLRIAHETSNQSEAERALAVQRAERYESERDAARHRLTFMEENTLPDLHRRAKADRETIGRWRTRARSTEATIGRVRAATTKTLLAGPDAVQVVRLNAIHAALDYSDAEPAELVHPDTEQQVSSPEQVDDIAAVRSAVARTQERCQAVRDREGPGGMINATQVLGLLSPTWPDGNYEGAAPGSTKQPTTEAGNTSAAEAGSPRDVCVCGHTRGEHVAVSGRLLCDACDPESTDNLVCSGFDVL